MKDPLIILIGGAAGTAKTSIGKEICNELNIAHRMGSGFIREAAKSFITRNNNPYLYNYSFSPHNDLSPFENLYKQSECINDAMELCISRAFNEGTSLLIEGVNVIPGLISTKNVSLNIIFSVDDFDKHLEMISGKTHFKREISDLDFKNVRKIQEDFKNRAEIYKWPIINLSSKDDIIFEIKSMLK